MKTHGIKRLSISLAILAGLAAGSYRVGLAWQSTAQAGQTKASSPSQPDAAAGQKVLGPAADSIQPYKSAGRDPFRKAVVKVTTTRVARQVGFPPLDARRAQFRQKLSQAHTSGGPEPDPLTQYLVSELNVIGTFNDEHGPGVFLRAQPTGTTFFVRRGARCYNGEVMRVEGDASDMSSTRVVFREVSYLEQNGKETPTERVVAKSAAPRN
jgi:hypothetical protein